MYAIIEDSGTQIKVQEGDVIDVDLRPLDDGTSSLSFDRVLVVGDGESAGNIGTPYVSGAKVAADIVGEIKGDKIDVIKFKRRKGYRRKQGHRQRYLRVKITGISA
ncbi:MAG: 50S ribosomal protein L21 [Planctomycetota bacterium]